MAFNLIRLMSDVAGFAAVRQLYTLAAVVTSTGAPPGWAPSYLWLLRHSAQFSVQAVRSTLAIAVLSLQLGLVVAAGDAGGSI